MYSRTRHPFIRCTTSACVNYISRLDLYFLKPHKLYFISSSNKDWGILFHHPTLAASQTTYFSFSTSGSISAENETREQGFPLTIKMWTPPRQVSYILCVPDRIPSFSCLCVSKAFPTLPTLFCWNLVYLLATAHYNCKRIQTSRDRKLMRVSLGKSTWE